MTTKAPTKAQIKAAAVEENRRVAFIKRVRNLTGQLVGQRMDVGAALAYYVANATAYDYTTAADAYAAHLASQEPVGRVVHPLKADAVKAAGDKARATVERVKAKLVEAGWNISVAAPGAPRTMSAWSHEYKALNAKRSLFQTLTEEDKAATSAWHAAAPEDQEARREYFRAGRPEIVTMSERGVARFVEQAEQVAALEYDAFTCKLVAKIGDCDEATLTGSHVWAHSVLTVRKGDTVERWKTQQIWNVSKLGNEFPQWPTRLMKR